MFEDLAATNGMRFLLAAAAVAVGLVILIVVLRILRNRPSSPFVRGGKNRQPRLAVLDAAAVDTRRRLVLVRRDDVEHLIMIGGPSDLVIESRIVGARPAAAPPAAEARRPAEAQPAPQAEPARERPAMVERRAEPRPVPVPPPPPQAAAAQPLPVTPGVSAMGQVLYGEEASAAPRPQPVRRPEAAPTARTAAGPAAAPRPEAARPAPVPVGRSPEDILDAARSRVLSTPPAEARPAPAPVVAPPAAPPAPEAARREGEFERLLDAEISGDLSRLGAGPAARPAERATPARQEPTLEEEMNRMLGEMGTTRRS